MRPEDIQEIKRMLKISNERHEIEKTMRKEDLVEFLKSVYYDDSKEVVDLSELDFGEYSVDISNMRVKGDLYQDNQRVKGDLFQDWQEVEGDLHQNWQKVEGNLHQDGQTVEGDLHQDTQTVEGDLNQDSQRVERDLYQHYQTVEGDLFQDTQKVKGDLHQDSQKVRGDLVQDWQEVEGDLNKEIAVKIRNENQQLTSPTEKETLYFDAKKSVGFKVNFNIIHFHLKEQLFDCHGLTKEETKERGYDWPSYLFATEKPKPLKIINGRVE